MVFYESKTSNKSNGAKNILENKKKQYESLIVQAATGIDTQGWIDSPKEPPKTDLRKNSKEIAEQPQSRQIPEEIRNSTENSKTPESFEVKDYNASPKLAVKSIFLQDVILIIEKEKKRQYVKQNTKPLIAPKKVPEPEIIETKKEIMQPSALPAPLPVLPPPPPLGGVSKDERREPAPIENPENFAPINLIKVNVNKKEIKKVSKKENKRITLIKKTMS